MGLADAYFPRVRGMFYREIGSIQMVFYRYTCRLRVANNGTFSWPTIANSAAKQQAADSPARQRMALALPGHQPIALPQPLCDFGRLRFLARQASMYESSREGWISLCYLTCNLCLVPQCQARSIALQNPYLF